MALQHHVNRSAALAMLSTVVWMRLVRGSLLVAMLFLSITFWAQMVGVLLFLVFIYPRISKLQSLPLAPQRPWTERMFKEPSPYHFAQWINTVPNDGLIRYFGILNTERVLVTSPEAVRQILQINPYDFEKQYAQKMHLQRVAGKSLVWHEGHMHKRHRKVLEVAFKYKYVTSLHASFWNKATQLVDTICNQVHRGQGYRSPSHTIDNFKSPTAVVELTDVVNRAVFDMIGLVGAGHDFKSLSNPEETYDGLQDYRNAHEPSPSARRRVMASFVLPRWLLEILPLENNIATARGMKRLREIGKTVIANKKSHQIVPLATHNVLQVIADQNQFSDEELMDTFLSLVPGGSHSTSITLLSTIWFLAQPKYYHVQQRLRDEIRQRLPDGNDPRILETMPYLQAVINEVVRLHSAFSWLGRMPIKPVTVCGHDLPAQLSISLSPWALHRSTAIWGPDAQEFNPDRWLTTEGIMENRHSWLAFGGGPRTCIGSKLALASLRCFVSAIFGRLDIRFADGEMIPTVTHTVALAFKSPLRPVVRILD